MVRVSLSYKSTKKRPDLKDKPIEEVTLPQKPVELYFMALNLEREKWKNIFRSLS
jgi:hypothetical protein